MGAVARMVQQWTSAVNDLFDASLHGHTAKALACFSFAMCHAGHCHSGRLAASAAVGPAKPASVRRRWERLLANERLDGRQALSSFAASLLSGWSGRRRLLLVLDETPNGGDLRCMRLGVAYRKRLLSIDAVTYPTDRPPMPMPKLICKMLARAAELLPDDARVTLLCDRGLSWPAVMDRARALGWGHVMRLQSSTRVTLLPGGRVVAAGELVRSRGGQWHGAARVFKKAGWRDAHLSVCWDPAGKEPWILASRSEGTDPHGLHAARAYAKRNWCEQTFRDEKSGGFHWDQSHVRQPRRALTMVLVMALATLLSISLGTWLIKSGRRRDFDPHRERRLSLFQLGLRWIDHLSVTTQEPPIPPYLPYLHPS